MSDLAHCVVDASVAIKLFVNQDESDKAEELFALLVTQPETTLYVPDLFYVECANVLWQYVRRAGYPEASAKASLIRLQSLDLRRVFTTDLVDKALEIAVAQNISVYDACYVRLSDHLSLPLVTADQKLIRALVETDYQVYSLTTFFGSSST